MRWLKMYVIKKYDIDIPNNTFYCVVMCHKVTKIDNERKKIDKLFISINYNGNETHSYTACIVGGPDIYI